MTSHPVPVLIVDGIDGTPNKAGQITEVCGSHPLVLSSHRVDALCSHRTWLGDVILGFKWLKEHNPEINWKQRR